MVGLFFVFYQSRNLLQLNLYKTSCAHRSGSALALAWK